MTDVQKGRAEEGVPTWNDPLAERERCNERNIITNHENAIASTLEEKAACEGRYGPESMIDLLTDRLAGLEGGIQQSEEKIASSLAGQIEESRLCKYARELNMADPAASHTSAGITTPKKVQDTMIAIAKENQETGQLMGGAALRDAAMARMAGHDLNK